MKNSFKTVTGNFLKLNQKSDEVHFYRDRKFYKKLPSKTSTRPIGSRWSVVYYYKDYFKGDTPEESLEARTFDFLTGSAPTPMEVLRLARSKDRRFVPLIYRILENGTRQVAYKHNEFWNDTIDWEHFHKSKS